MKHINYEKKRRLAICGYLVGLVVAALCVGYDVGCQDTTKEANAILANIMKPKEEEHADAE